MRVEIIYLNSQLPDYGLDEIETFLEELLQGTFNDYYQYLKEFISNNFQYHILQFNRDHRTFLNGTHPKITLNALLDQKDINSVEYGKLMNWAQQIEIMNNQCSSIEKLKGLQRECQDTFDNISVVRLSIH